MKECRAPRTRSSRKTLAGCSFHGHPDWFPEANGVGSQSGTTIQTLPGQCLLRQKDCDLLMPLAHICNTLRKYLS